MLIFVPIALTIFLIIWIFTSFDSLYKVRIPNYFTELGLIISLVLITFVGFLASNYLGRKIFSLIDRIFASLPLVKLLYSAVKDILEAFAGDKKSFDKPVIVSVGPGSNVKIVGFITRDSLEHFGLAEQQINLFLYLSSILAKGHRVLSIYRLYQNSYATLISRVFLIQLPLPQHGHP